jgi:hypothetical protein
MEYSTSYFDKPLIESIMDFDPVDAPSEFSSAVIKNTTTDPAPAHIEREAIQEPDYEYGEAASYYEVDPSMPIAEAHPVHE